jgi:Holliday junction DNA helicase RuvA
MIAKIKGIITDKKENSLVLNVGGMFYEVITPKAVLKAVESLYDVGAEVELVTYHYYQLEPSRGVPVLVGFQNEIEKEFFEKFISVSGVGPKAACKALVEPISLTAGAIDAGDVGFLKKLPGIGEQKAKLIVAKLQGKVGKFGLIKDGIAPSVKEGDDFRQEALDVLLQLQYKKFEAEEMIKKACARNPSAKTSEELLNEIYREKVKI